MDDPPTGSAGPERDSVQDRPNCSSPQLAALERELSRALRTARYLPDRSTTSPAEQYVASHTDVAEALNSAWTSLARSCLALIGADGAPASG
jgi:hypothetical protein